LILYPQNYNIFIIKGVIIYAIKRANIFVFCIVVFLLYYHVTAPLKLIALL